MTRQTERLPVCSGENGERGSEKGHEPDPSRATTHPKFLDALAAWGVQVGLGTIGPRSGVAAQARFFRYSPLFLEAGYSIRTSQRYRAGLSFARGPNLFETAYTFQRNAEPYFWGVGPDTEEENQSDYLLDHRR